MSKQIRNIYQVLKDREKAKDQERSYWNNRKWKTDNSLNS